MLLWILISFPVLAVAKCPLLEAIESTEYNSCYVKSNFAASWTAAESICKNLGGHLPSVKDLAENDYFVNITDTFYLDSIWLGASEVNRQWSWTDGSNFGYNNFDGKTSGTVGRLVVRHPDNSWAGGIWVKNQPKVSNVQSFLCESGPSLLSTSDNETGLLFISLNNFWYYSNPTMLEQSRRADIFCQQQLGGNLPSITSGFENTWIQNAFKILNGLEHSVFDEYFSIGYFTDKKNAWRWTDGNTATYVNWGATEPLNEGEMSQIAIMSMLAGRWQSDINFDLYYYMCELPARLNYCE